MMQELEWLYNLLLFMSALPVSTKPFFPHYPCVKPENISMNSFLYFYFLVRDPLGGLGHSNTERVYVY
jgi:hypothetical protein